MLYMVYCFWLCKNCIISSSGGGISTVGSGMAVSRNTGVISSTCGGSSTGGSGNIGVSSSSSTGRSSTGVGSSGLLKLARLLSRHQVLTLRDNKLGGSYWLGDPILILPKYSFQILHKIFLDTTARNWILALF